MTSVSLTPWQVAPDKPCLDSASVHLWRFRLNLPEAELAPLKSLLSEDEQERVERLRIPQKGNQLLVARARLRQILARYLDSTAELTFSYQEHGKPYLPDESVFFNLSHAGEWGVLVIGASGELGVDLERLDPALDSTQIAPRYFSKTELVCLQASPAARRQRTFYRLWTRKEALLKGQGTGFSVPQCVPCAANWQVRSFVLDRHHLGAVAMLKPVSSVQRWHFS